MHDLIDLSRYPLDRPADPAFGAVLADIHAALDHDGCAVLPGFVRKDAVAALVAEADAAAPHAHVSRGRTNAYFTQDDPALPPEHPKRRFFDRSNAFIPADNFGAGSLLRRLYEWPAFRDFAQAALREEAFYPYADPLADVIVNAAGSGNGFPWHFDTNTFTLTLAIQNAEDGGAFEYAPGIREGSENFDAVAAVLDGTTERVTRLWLEPGDLQIFQGRTSLHRVTPLAGDRPRYVAIFSFVDDPDMVATPERAKQLYGRALPIHYARAGRRMDSYID